ncbi:hypothetical protein [Staphylococcus shinii]|uniref:hypothetical protein n=1 Tax=Staphylococcus shinii TaxID=2912228 RepID=UPI003EED9AC0
MNIENNGIEKNFEIGDIVVVDDPTCLYNNKYYDLESEEQVELDKPYEIIDCDIELADEFEVLYTLKDNETGVICGVMFNDWEIEKANKVFTNKEK